MARARGADDEAEAFCVGVESTGCRMPSPEFIDMGEGTRGCAWAGPPPAFGLRSGREGADDVRLPGATRMCSALPFRGSCGVSGVRGCVGNATLPPPASVLLALASGLAEAARARGLGTRSGRVWGMLREAVDMARECGGDCVGDEATLPPRWCCWAVGLGGGRARGLVGVAGRLEITFWYFWCRKEAEVGDMGGLDFEAGVGGGGQMWSPSSAMGTG